MAIQLKLSELIASQKTASNRVIDIEDLSEQGLYTFKRFYITLSELAEKEHDVFSTHSVDEAAKIQKEQRQHEYREWVIISTFTTSTNSSSLVFR